MRVLLVDDDPIVRHNVKKSLLGAGYDVISASTGGVAMSHFHDNPADILIANVYMAEVGVQAVQLGIIALSPSPVPEGYLSAAKAFGASQIFMKPFDSAILIEAVRRLVRY